jgi:hypothetical protein
VASCREEVSLFGLTGLTRHLTHCLNSLYREQPGTTLSTVAETLEFSSEEVRQKRQSFSNCAGCVAMINIFVSHACGSHQ